MRVQASRMARSMSPTPGIVRTLFGYGDGIVSRASAALLLRRRREQQRGALGLRCGRERVDGDRCEAVAGEKIGEGFGREAERLVTKLAAKIVAVVGE